MYAILEWVYGANRTNIIADLVKVLTGETNKANLSADLTQANSSIISTVAAGWTVHDASVATYKQCVKAPLSDDGTKFKYVVLDHGSATNVLYILPYETWDAGTHTGTGSYTGCGTSSHNLTSTPASNVLKIRISASARHLLMLTYHGGVKQGSASGYGQGPVGAFERTRMMAWDTVAAGFIPAVWSNLGSQMAAATNNTGAGSPTLKKYDGTTGSIYLQMATIGSSRYLNNNAEYPYGTTAFVKDASNNDTIPLFPLYWINPATITAPLGEISSMCDIWGVPGSVLVDWDDFTLNGNTYTCFGTAGPAIAVRKG